MHEVIQKVIATEAEAKRMVQAARSEAELILSAAQKRAQEMTRAARQEVQIESGKILAAATAAAEGDQQTRLATVAGEIENQVHLDAAARQRVGAAVVRCVCG